MKDTQTIKKQANNTQKTMRISGSEALFIVY